ncbi:type II toxin-antitoxin system PemK/MazF family toxin [Oerskovia paurometabola]|uniref:Type II toxin-antitoxin system PemK/MazF family toxin n=1 Tax=Oerskovia paurometabola TaxID=162170 RepID=A0ABW1X616_9CELL|nr:type II toxin-antitoxin system PemK/MazF family toxin [Oerskovia paurometabola]MBM7495621.1 mRNA interferase MazF [Oerskovia paurometabola]
MIRGAVYRVDLGAPRGHEQGGRRYGLVLSPSEMNWSVATIVPTSTSARPATFRPELVIDGQQTLLLVDQIRTVDTAYLVGDPVDYLNHDELTTVEQAVIHYLGLV